MIMLHALWGWSSLQAHQRGGTLQVVNLVAPTLLKTSRLLREASFHPVQGSSPSSFSGLHHLTLMIDPRQYLFATPSQLNNLMAEIADHSQLESLYIGFISGFDGSCHDGLRTDPEDSINLCLSSMQHLKSVHLDSFWPTLLELPPRASLHATFQPTLGQKHLGLWAGRPADVQNPRLPLKSAHFLHAGLDAEHALTAKELWPLRVKCLDLYRVAAGTLHLDLSDFQAERVLIRALECDLFISSNQVAFKHLKIRVSERLELSLTDAVAFAAQVETLTIICKHLMALSAVMRNALLAAGKRIDFSCSRNQCNPKGRSQPQSFVLGDACLRVGSNTMDAGERAHAMACCCHACLACLHRDGAAAFPEAIAEEEGMFGA